MILLRFDVRGEGSMIPEARLKQDRIIGLLDLGEFLLGALTTLLGTLRAEALARVNAAKHVVPELEEESSVQRSVLNRDCVVAIVLKRSVDDGGVRIGPGKLVSPVKVDTVSIEEDAELKKHQIDVHRHDDWKNGKRSRPNELVNVLVSNNCKRGWIVEEMVMLVLLPAVISGVPKPVVVEFVEIRTDPHHHKFKYVIPCSVRGPATVGLRKALLCQI
mmetsp:Transcript_6493/g.14993  ORF Transcript_6493/g.14993 Transcript_6493/m.14993 type:complete len:218 (-) Transcript_6493:283-936(-)